MTSESKWAVAIGLLVVLAALLLKHFLATGSQVTSQVTGFEPTQLGAPQSVIDRLSGSQLSSDVTYWIDPTTGAKVLNTPQVLGALPMVALTDENQIHTFLLLNPKAVADMVQ